MQSAPLTRRAIRSASASVPRARVWLGAIVALALSPVPAGAGDERTSARAAFLNRPLASDAGLEVRKIDINGDGRPDVFAYYSVSQNGARRLVHKDTDLNWDGRIDVRTWYDGQGRISEEEMDGDFDGRVDWVDLYQDGVRTRCEVDTDYDGQFDLFKTYVNGQVARRERDTDGNGRIDFREDLDASGKVVKLSRDLDGDGVMDDEEQPPANPSPSDHAG